MAQPIRIESLNPQARNRGLSLRRIAAIVTIAVALMIGISFFAIAAPVSADAGVSPGSRPLVGVGSFPLNSSSAVGSYNWSGYAVTGSAGSVTSVSGSWTVPSETCTSSQTYAAFWVGIDGFNSGTVEQTGTLAECIGGTPYNFAWYEFYPSSLVELWTVSTGDSISASVTYSASTNKFTTTVTDTTSKTSYTTLPTSVTGAKESSAEWIAEAPSSYNGILPLADFGTVNFGSSLATISGHSGSINSFTSVYAITMISSSGAKEAVPSALSTDGTSFSVTWMPTNTSTTSSTSTHSSTKHHH